MFRWLVALWLAVFFAAGAAAAQLPERPAGPILDQADLLTPAQQVDLTGKLTAFNDRSGRALVVVTVKSLGGQEIQPYANDLGRKWGIGDEQTDTGVLLLVAPNERKVWIATGYGADDYLTDAMAGTIIRSAILPRFKAGDMGGGIVAGADAIIQQLELPPEEAAKRAQAAQNRARDRQDDVGLLPVIVIVFVFFMIIGGINGMTRGGRRYQSRRRRGGIDPVVVLWGLEALSHASRGRGGWGGGGGFGGFGGGGGGFGGFGGGSFGGGGAGAAGDTRRIRGRPSAGQRSDCCCGNRNGRRDHRDHRANKRFLPRRRPALRRCGVVFLSWNRCGLAAFARLDLGAVDGLERTAQRTGDADPFTGGRAR
ncbi:TPM domain-containing protein [Sphingomonas sp. HDW15A]|nr:TPM domain-containing protein [Sphingomonas sp. HDW15A]